MTPLRWLLLGVIFTVYLLFGGSIFMVLEQRNELREHAELTILRKDIQEILFRLDHDFYTNGTLPEVLEAIQAAKEGVVNRISQMCGNTNLLDENSVNTIRWTFYNSVFFAFTAITTIGYGNLAPDTHWSRIFTIFYALIGIPINGVLITNLSDFFSSKLVKAHKRSKEKESRMSFVFNIIFYLIPGLLVFIIAPAGFFVMIENWTYSDAIYFSFVTLTTIGFGDYVAGMGDGHNIWLWIYKIVIIVWIVFGLGYLVMILGFITKGITSKKVRVVIGRRLNKIRITKEKLSRDVEYIRKVVNEIYLMKVEPEAYEDELTDPSGPYDYFLFDGNTLGLQRTMSLNMSLNKCKTETRGLGRARSNSEGDLHQLRKLRALEEAKDDAIVDTKEILAQLVASLQGNISNVIEAVNELNEYDNEEVDEAFGSDEIDTEQDQQSEPKPELENLPLPPAWELGMLTESDEEILLDDDEEDCLQQVVVHKGESSKVGTAQGILDKVTGVLRKISTGTKNSNDAGSRKVSRNEPEDRNRNFSSNQVTRKISKNSDDPNPSICGFPSGPTPDTGSIAGAQSGDIASCNSPSLSISRTMKLASSNAKRSPYDSTNHSTPSIHRKISKEEAKKLSRTVVLDSTTLADFMKALDNVHDRLKSFDNNLPEDEYDGAPTNGSRTQYQLGGNDNLAFSFDSAPSTPPLLHEKRLRMRRRKVGVFNPEFKYFIPDVTGNAIRKNTPDGGGGDGNDISFL